MGKLYGWYSLNAYLRGGMEYIYKNNYNQLTYCTIVTTNKKSPYGINSLYSDVVYCGEIRTPH